MSDWIKCSDRLPKVGERVLVCSVYGAVQHCAYYRDADDDNDFWQDTYDLADGRALDEVTHWMPLPAAPTPQGGE